MRGDSRRLTGWKNKIITLDKRLKTIYDLIDKKVVADIGSDHGFLPAVLILNGVCKKVYVTDISEKSLDKARELFKQYNIDYLDMDYNATSAEQQKSKTNCCFEGDQYSIKKTNSKFETKLYFTQKNSKKQKTLNNDKHAAFFWAGAGLRVFNEPIKNAVCVIAGLGGEQIIEMLKDNNDRNIFDEFILQPMKSVIKVRAFLMSNGFYIKTDIKVKANNKFYDIIKAEKYSARNCKLRLAQDNLSFWSGSDRILHLMGTSDKREGLSDCELQFGKTNLQGKNPDFNEFAAKELQKFEKVIKNMKTIDTKALKYVTMLKQVILNIE